MNHKILSLFLVLAGVLSCSTKTELPTEQIETVESLSFPGSGGSKELVFSTDDRWEASSSEWCTVYPSSGSGRFLHKQVITVICEPNEGSSERGCYLTLRTTSQSVYVSITQGPQK